MMAIKRPNFEEGVNQSNAALLYHAGARALVAGNFVFTAADPVQTIAELKKVW